MSDVAVFVDGIKFNFRVSALIENKGRYLLEKSIKTDFLNMPGGRVLAGESTLDAIKRELEEELKLENVAPKLIKISEQFFVFDNTKYHELNFVYYVKLKNNNPLAQSDNIQNYDNQTQTMLWIKRKNLKKYKILPEFIYTIKKSRKISHLVKKEIEK